MIYCEGKNCSIRDNCLMHQCFANEELRQAVDYSTTGSGSVGIDVNGHYYSNHEYDCGDNAKYYTYYQSVDYSASAAEGNIVSDEQVEAFEDDLRDCFTISELCEGYEYIDFTETARKLLQLGYYKIGG